MVESWNINKTKKQKSHKILTSQGSPKKCVGYGTCNQQVGGSSPSTSSNSPLLSRWTQIFKGILCRMLSCFLPRCSAAGSAHGLGPWCRGFKSPYFDHGANAPQKMQVFHTFDCKHAGNDSYPPLTNVSRKRQQTVATDRGTSALWVSEETQWHEYIWWGQRTRPLKPQPT